MKSASAPVVGVEPCRCGAYCDDRRGAEPCQGKVLQRVDGDRHECEVHAHPPECERIARDPDATGWHP